jgi:hypothetical protein
MGLAFELLTQPVAVATAVVASLQQPVNLAILATMVIIGAYQLVAHTYHPPNVAIFGGRPKVIMTANHLAPEFEELRKVFIGKVTSGQELAVQYVVYWQGKKVVDLCAAQQYVKSTSEELDAEGGADEYDYNPHTAQLSWAAKEVFVSLAIAMAEDRGWLQYDDPVAKHWPEFGADGKADILVANLMRHDAGLWAVDPPLHHAEVGNSERLADRLAAARTSNPRDFGAPSGRCYHAYTREWVCSELIRRLDPAKRSLDQFIHDEVVTPLRLSEEGGCYLGSEQPKNFDGKMQPGEGGLRISAVVIPPPYRV